MEQAYKLDGHVLTFRARKAPLLVRSIMFFFAFLFFILPITGMVMGLAFGKGLHVGYLIGIFLFGIMGFYMLRMSLWNTYGREIIAFSSTEITYMAHYGWFTDGKKQKEISGSIEFSTRQIGYDDDDTRGLVIGLDEPIICVTKLPSAELEELIEKLNDLVG